MYSKGVKNVPEVEQKLSEPKIQMAWVAKKFGPEKYFLFEATNLVGGLKNWT